MRILTQTVLEINILPKILLFNLEQEVSCIDWFFLELSFLAYVLSNTNNFYQTPSTTLVKI